MRAGYDGFMAFGIRSRDNPAGAKFFSGGTPSAMSGGLSKDVDVLRLLSLFFPKNANPLNRDIGPEGAVVATGLAEAEPLPVLEAECSA